MDLDDDGKADIITGSYDPGHLYFFRNTGEAYAKGEILNYADGKPIVVGAASTPFAFDWNGDGKLDLLVGDISGHVWVLPGKGKLAWTKGEKLRHKAAVIRAEHGDSQPVMADWDGDGVADLLLGHGDGSVTRYRNSASKGEPKLADPVTLIEKSDRTLGKPGIRAKLCVTDYDGDGKMDLLVGDANYKELPAPDLTEEQKKEAEEVNKRQQKLMEQHRALHRALYKKKRDEAIAATAKSEDELTEEELNELEKGIRKSIEADADYQKLIAEIMEIFEKADKYRGGYEHLGNVWLFRRAAKDS